MLSAEEARNISTTAPVLSNVMRHIEVAAWSGKKSLDCIIEREDIIIKLESLGYIVTKVTERCIKVSW